MSVTGQNESQTHIHIKVAYSTAKKFVIFVHKLRWIYTISNYMLWWKVKQFHYRTWGLQEIGDIRHMKVVRLSVLRTDRLYPQEIFLLLISVRDWVNLRTVVQPEELCQWKIPITPSRIEPATSRLVAQCLNPLMPKDPYRGLPHR